MMVCDAHNDLLLELAARPELGDPFGELWLEQLRRGGVHLQVCPMYGDALADVMGQAAAFHRAARQHPDEVMVVRTRDDVAARPGSTRTR